MFRPILDMEAVYIQGPEHIFHLFKVQGPFWRPAVGVADLGDANAHHHMDMV